MSALFAFLHHVAAFALFAGIFVEFLLIKEPLTLESARRLLRIDAMVGISAGVLVVVGALRVVRYEKGLDFYLHSVPFIAKMALFVLVALLSIYPTVKFLSWRPALKQAQVPALDAASLRKIRGLLHAELAGVLLIILMAALMARGIWMFE